MCVCACVCVCRYSNQESWAWIVNICFVISLKGTVYKYTCSTCPIVQVVFLNEICNNILIKKMDFLEHF